MEKSRDPQVLVERSRLTLLLGMGAAAGSGACIAYPPGTFSPVVQSTSPSRGQPPGTGRGRAPGQSPGQAPSGRDPAGSGTGGGDSGGDGGSY